MDKTNIDKIFSVQIKLRTPNELGTYLSFVEKTSDIVSVVKKFNENFDFKKMKMISIEKQSIKFLLYILVASDDVPVTFRDLSYFSKRLYHDFEWKQYSRQQSSLFTASIFTDVTEKYLPNFSKIPDFPEKIMKNTSPVISNNALAGPSFMAAFESRTDLKKYKENALLLFALQIKFNIEDIHSVAANSLTGDNDKKADLIYVDVENGSAVIAQAYYSSNSSKPAAPSSKASDLNTAISWVLCMDIDKLPLDIKSASEELRTAIAQNKIETIHFWYVHNLPESSNTEEELHSVEISATNALKIHFSECVNDVKVSALEVGLNTLEDWYRTLTIPIKVSKKFNIKIDNGYTIRNGKWSAFVTSIPAKWLQEIYNIYKDDIFSANPRNYLGDRKSDKNINSHIKATINITPSDFWVYNNGLTALVHSFTPPREGNSEKILSITGISIINGAQTTGAIGTTPFIISDKIMVQARFVVCDDFETIRKIIKYNNSQNKLEPADFRSNDSIQDRLRNEFDQIPDTEYNGGKRGGYDEITRKPQNLLPNSTVAQSLMAFHYDPIIAYNDKSKIWEENSLYEKIFNENTTAEHIVFVYSLLCAINNIKLNLITKTFEKESKIMEMERSQLDFLRMKGSVFLLLHAIAKGLEIIVNRKIPNSFEVSFKSNISLNAAKKQWEPIVNISLSFCKQLSPAIINGMKNKENINSAIENFRSMLDSTKNYNDTILVNFAHNCIMK